VANGGGTVVEVEDATNGLCLATASNGKAELGACLTNGYGGAAGNIFVYGGPENNFGIGVLFSNYWTNSLGHITCAFGQDTNGAPIYLNVTASTSNVNGCDGWNKSQV
jgi:hypothetical protein